MARDEIRQWLDENAEERVKLELMVIREITPVIVEGKPEQWHIKARRPRRGTWYDFEVVETDSGYDVSRVCQCVNHEDDCAEFKGVTELADFLHVLSHYQPGFASYLWLRMQEEVKTWTIPMVNRKLREDFLLTRVYSISEIKVLHVDQRGAHVAYKVYFRDLGMDFDMSFDARLRWSDLDIMEGEATVEVTEGTWDHPVVVKTRTAAGLAECVFGHFRVEHERRLAEVMEDTRKLRRVSRE